MKPHHYYTNILSKLVLIVWIGCSSLVVSAQLAAPRELRQTLLNDERVRLSWTFTPSVIPNLRARIFQVERSTGDRSHFTYIGNATYSEGETVFYFENEYREPGDYYCYRVRAIYRDDVTMLISSSYYSNIVCVDARVGIPNTLQILSYNFPTSSVKLAWNAAYLNQTYVLERSEGDVSNFIPITPRSYEPTQFEDRGEVIRGRRYYYRVKARGFHHYSDYSNIVEFYEPPFPIPIQIYIQQIIRQGRPVIRLDWLIDLDKQTHFVVERSDLVKNKFYEVGKVTGDLREFFDEKPFEKGISFYRIKIMSGGEILGYSDVAESQLSEVTEEIIAFPNPFKDYFTIQLPEKATIGKVVVLSESTGKEVDVEVKSDNNLLHVYPSYDLKEGYYVVYAISEKGEELAKFRMYKADK